MIGIPKTILMCSSPHEVLTEHQLIREFTSLPWSTCRYFRKCEAAGRTPTCRERDQNLSIADGTIGIRKNASIFYIDAFSLLLISKYTILPLSQDFRFYPCGI